MMPRRLSEVAAATGGRVVGDDVEVRSVVVDSRKAEPDSLFVALTGEVTDGHGFVADARGAGAVAALVAADGAALGPGVVVPDTGAALLALAAAERGAFAGRVVGITGSTGKTSTKDLVAAVLEVRHRVAASPASFNNQVGLPLTVLGMEPGTEVLVCEMGASSVGEIRMMCRVARPDVGVVTNVGLAHLGRFGSRENIVRAKAELVEELPADGIAVLNADDPVVRGYAARTDARSVLYGAARDADVRAEDVSLDDLGQASFTLVSGTDRERVQLGVPGEHMVSNALAAAATGIALGVGPAGCAAALEAARVSAWRMETFTTPGGIRVLNDAYNANPTSMPAALKAARWMSRDGRCIAVLGHMAELGEASREEHERIGEIVARLGIDELVVVGEEARPLARGAVREGVEPDRVHWVATPEEALEEVGSIARSGDLVVLKGSRVAGLERVAEALR
ncbi:MAG: UDP-N-acetylmuramoyl-tripeptide--D-alanyl-D-alanine ligase [Actinobacteria bacterium]|nr:UDP-N-acetylmuramoyl-tripeptide--D-alanyl-D-alanine ligase [Actinomycetota bacterium]